MSQSIRSKILACTLVLSLVVTSTTTVFAQGGSEGQTPDSTSSTQISKTTEQSLTTEDTESQLKCVTSLKIKNLPINNPTNSYPLSNTWAEINGESDKLALGWVSWVDSPSEFIAGEIYTAEVTFDVNSAWTDSDYVFDDEVLVSLADDSIATIKNVQYTGTDGYRKVIVTLEYVPFVKSLGEVSIPVNVATVGEIPQQTIAATDDYTGTIAWSGDPEQFVYGESYTATITLNASQYHNFYESIGNSDILNTNGRVISIVNTGNTLTIEVEYITSKKIICEVSLPIMAPAIDQRPQYIVSATDAYTGTITWVHSPSEFVQGRSYVAIVTLHATADYQFDEFIDPSNIHSTNGTVVSVESIGSSLVAVIEYPVVVKLINTVEVVFSPLVAGNVPPNSILGSNDYTGTISWHGNPDQFEIGKPYSATITIFAYEYFKFSDSMKLSDVYGIKGNILSFRNTGGTLIIEVEYPAVNRVINYIDMPIKAPTIGGIPQSTIATADFTGTVTWNDSPTTFVAEKSYIATIHLTVLPYHVFNESKTAKDMFGTNDERVKSFLCTDTSMTIVMEFPPMNAKVEGIRTLPSVTLSKGKSVTLPTIFMPISPTDKKVTWTSSNKSVVSVSSNGKITGIKAGTARITVTTNDGIKESSCIVTVVNGTVPLTGITVAPNTSGNLLVGKSLQIKTANIPKNATGVTYKYTSSNSKIATVDKLGKVTAVKPGKVTITVQAGTFKKKITVVVGTVAATKVTIAKSATTLKTGKTLTLKATLAPVTASPQTVTWMSSDKSIATVSSKGIVKGLKPGKVTITAKTWNGKIAKRTITVR